MQAPLQHLVKQVFSQYLQMQMVLLPVLMQTTSTIISVCAGNTTNAKGTQLLHSLLLQQIMMSQYQR